MGTQRLSFPFNESCREVSSEEGQKHLIHSLIGRRENASDLVRVQIRLLCFHVSTFPVLLYTAVRHTDRETG